MRYLMGSSYFFKGYKNFFPHDTDYIEITDGENKKTLAFVQTKTKEEFIQNALKSPAAMVLGKFLIPEFCQEIGFTIEDLSRLEPLISRLDPKHVYEQIIYSAYLENQSFTLTKKQRNTAFKSYINSRRYIR